MPAGEVDTGAPAKVKPVVTANRRETVDAKVARLFERNGAAFGSRTAEDYLARLEAFTGSPPADAETVRRPNGDTLIYQASTNTFAVVARDGTARTMFKPDGGAAYWAEQKAAAPTFGQRRQRPEG
jgi:pyocin large subunit-like protein